MAEFSFQNATLKMVIIGEDGIARTAFLREADDQIVTGPSSAVSGHLAVFADTSGQTLEDGGAVPAGGGDVLGPSSSTTGHLAVFADETGKLLEDGGAVPGGGGVRMSIIDLGLIDIRDAVVNGITSPLIAYAEGRLLSTIRFVPGGVFDKDGPSLYFATPNTAYNTGGTASPTVGYDTIGNFTQGDGDWISILGDSNAKSQILDVCPLVLGTYYNGLPHRGIQAWQSNHPYCQGDIILDPADHVQLVGTNGVSGATIPTFDDNEGETIDGTVHWFDNRLIPTGTIHAIAEVIEGADPTPPYPATLEFIAQPQNTVAEEPIPDITVIIKDQNGDPYNFGNGGDLLYINLLIYGDGTLVGTNNIAVDAVTGISTFSGLSITEPAEGYILRAHLALGFTADPIFSDPFDVTAP